MKEKESAKDVVFMMYSLIKETTRKAIINKRFLLVLLVMLFLAGVMGYAATQEPKGIDEGSTFLDILVISFFLPLITMIFGSSFIRDEIDDKSITSLLITPLGKGKIFFGYYISLVIVSILAMLLVVSSGTLAYFSVVGYSSGVSETYIYYVILAILGSMVYGSLFIIVSVLLERSIYFGLFYVFIWEGFVGSLPGRVKQVSIRHYLRSIGNELIGYGSIANYRDASGLNTSIITLTLITIVLLVTGAIIFREKEFP